jgi:lipopolysaccharide export system permease protein
VSGITPGMFRESSQSDRVYFVESLNMDSNRIGNIFVRSVQNTKLGTMVAREGFQQTMPNGDHFLVLLNGTRYEGTPGGRDYRIVEFKRYAMRIESAAATQVQASARTMPTPELWRNPTTWNLSELEWRLGLPLSAAVLALLAIPLSYVNPRAGRSLNLVMALVLYMLYSNLIGVSNTWVGQGKLPAMIGMWGIHILMLTITVMMFYRRMMLFSTQRSYAKVRAYFKGLRK